MANKIILKKSAVTDKIPLISDLEYGEVALNYTDGKLYFKTSSNQINAFTVYNDISSVINKREYVVTVPGTGTFNVDYQLGYVDVYVNGVKLNPDEFTALNGLSVTIPDLLVGDEVQLTGYRELSLGTTSTKYFRETYTATQGQTEFLVSYSRSSGGANAYVEVYINGAFIDRTEYTATDGERITLVTPANAGDIVECIGYKDFQILEMFTEGVGLSYDNITGTIILNSSANAVANTVALRDANAALVATEVKSGNTTFNVATNATTIGIGAATGTVTINNAALVHNSTGATTVASGTSLERPTGALGQIRYNSSLSTYEGYGAGGWGSLGGVKSVDGFTYIVPETSPGTSNGELEFYAENAAGTAAVKVAGINYQRFTENTGTVVGTQSTQNVFNTTATTVNFAGAATTLSIGSSTGNTTVNNNLIVSGGLTVNGTTTTINSTTLTVDDKNIIVASGAADSAAADGAGITVDGANASFTYASVGDKFVTNKPLQLPLGVAITEFSDDGSLAGNSDLAVPTEKAVKSYVNDFQAATFEPTGFSRGAATTMGVIEFTLDGTTIYKIDHTSALTTRTDGKFATGTVWETAATPRTLAMYPTTGQTEFIVWQSGIKYTITTLKTASFTAGQQASHYFFFDQGVLNSYTSITGEYIQKLAFVAEVYCDEAANEVVIFGEERHGITMDGATHLYLHGTTGTRYRSGLGITGITAGATTYSSTVGGVIYDEDIILNLGNQNTNSMLYMIGTAWKILPASNSYAYIVGGKAQYNQKVGGAYQLSDIPAGSYAVMYFMATNCRIHQTMKIMGQYVFTTLAEARESAQSEPRDTVLLGLPTPEFLYVGAVVVDSAGQVQTLDNGAVFVDLRLVNISAGTNSSSAAVVMTAQDSIYDNTGTGLSATNVQLALTELATEKVDRAGDTITGSMIINTNNATPSLRITQNGAGYALLVEDSANPDSSPFVINNTGQVLNGYTVSQSPKNQGLTFAALRSQVIGEDGNGSSTANIMFNTGSSIAPVVFLAKSRNATVGTQGALSSSDNVGAISFNASDGTSFVEAASILASVDGATGTNDMPGRLVFSTTADGASTPTERMRIDSQGRVGIGSQPFNGVGSLYAARNITGATFAYGILTAGAVQSDVTNTAYYYRTTASTAATTFTLSNLVHYAAEQSTIGAGSTVTNQVGFSVGSSLTGATNNYGFYGNIPSGTGRWNFYSTGTAQNYFAGNVGIGSSVPKNRLQVSGTAAVNAPTLGSIASDVPLYLTNNDSAYGLAVGTNSGDGHVWMQAQRTDATATAYNITFNEAGGNVGIGVVSPQARLQVEEAGFDTTTTSITTTAVTTIASFAAATFRTAEFLVQIVDASNSQYHSAKILVIHNGSTVNMVQYGVVHTAAELGTFDAVVSGSNVILQFTAAAATTKTVKVLATMLTA